MIFVICIYDYYKFFTHVLCLCPYSILMFILLTIFYVFLFYFILFCLDRPVTYLYNTLHYYERNLREKPQLKRRLVTAVLSSLIDVRSTGWSLSEPYYNYMTEKVTWIPDLDYYIQLVRRIVNSILLAITVFFILLYANCTTFSLDLTVMNNFL